jgi:hypothetical protein
VFHVFGTVRDSDHLEPRFPVYAWYMHGIYQAYVVLNDIHGYTWYILGYTMYIQQSGYTWYILGYTMYIHQVYPWYIHGYTWYIIGCIYMVYTWYIVVYPWIFLEF